MTDRDDAARRDRADPLRHFRDRFHPAEDGLVYLDGNSLGRLPAATARSLEEAIRNQWGERLIRGWEEGWLELPLSVGDRLAGVALGAGPGQVAVADSTTVCFYKLASAALAARPGRTEIVTDRDNFPTDRYVLEGLAAAHSLTIRWLTSDPHRGPEPDAVAGVVGPATALVALSHVAYRSGYVLELPAITAIAQQAGALVLWDLSHSAGSLPLALDRDGVDLAVGCTYKYLNGGPGSPAFVYVRAEHQPGLRQPIWGWLGRADPFAMAQGYEPAPGIEALLSGTPPVLALTAVAASLELLAEAGIEAVRTKAMALGDYTIELADSWLAEFGVSVGSPRNGAERGAHVALTHPNAAALCHRLRDAGVITDFRAPDVIRVGLSPLSTTFSEVRSGLERLRELLTDGP